MSVLTNITHVIKGQNTYYFFKLCGFEFFFHINKKIKTELTLFFYNFYFLFKYIISLPKLF